jgi:hypothetical protein
METHVWGPPAMPAGPLCRFGEGQECPGAGYGPKKVIARATRSAFAAASP